MKIFCRDSRLDDKYVQPNGGQVWAVVTLVDRGFHLTTDFSRTLYDLLMSGF